jgi:HAD superfamily hydrolase (TIGR01490 family)
VRIAAFDFDGTITTGDSFLGFVKFTRGKAALCKAALVYAPMLIAFGLKLYPARKAKQKLFSHFYKGVPLTQFNRWGEAFAGQIARHVRPKAAAAIAAHRKANDTVVIVSASVENWILPWARAQGIDIVLATQPETDASGNLTGRFRSPNCSGQEKVNRLQQQFPDRLQYELWAYGDSHGDRAMIEFADRGWYNRFK